MGRGATEQAPKQADHNTDRYPKAVQALRRMVEEGYFETTHIDRLEVRFQADGSGTYRYWAPRADESDGGYLPPA